VKIRLSGKSSDQAPGSGGTGWGGLLEPWEGFKLGRRERARAEL
jgi:hypothetical protein